MKSRGVITPIGPSIAYVPLTQGQYSIIDSDDAASVGKYNWTAVRVAGTNSFYAFSGVVVRGVRTRIGLHRFVMGMPEKPLVVDHIKGNSLDNRKSFLRIATYSQNLCNSKLPRNSTSGFKGVAWHKNRNKWVAYIRVDGSNHYLGVFETAEEASEARAAAAQFFHGEFARAA